METSVTERSGVLEQTREQLHRAQSMLVQNEKLSMLGQLAAGLAHEVNTPTGAIINVVAGAAEQLRDLLLVALEIGGRPAETRQWLAERVESLFEKKMIRSEIAVRSERRKLGKRLQEMGYADFRRIADVIISYEMTDWAENEEILTHVCDHEILSVLEHLLALKTCYDITDSSANRIARIVRSLRFYAHEGQGDTSEIDLNESIDNTLVILQSKLKYIAQVRTRFQAGLPPVRCGGDLLQVWTNILCNACDAIDGREGQPLPMIEIVTALEGDTIVVRISNEGPPIADEHIDRIFDPFFTTKPIGKGMGLGLSVCAGVLRRYSGQIAAFNEPGRVTFEVRLPVPPENGVSVIPAADGENCGQADEQAERGDAT